MEEEKVTINDYIEAYDNLCINDKKLELAKKISAMNNELQVLSDIVGKDENPFGEIILDENLATESLDSYFTRMFIYINSLDEQMVNLLDKLTKEEAED